MYNWRRLALPTVAGLSVFASRIASAQSGSSPFSTSVTATSGFTAGRHIDMNASPLPFSGTGYDAGLGFRRNFGALGRWRFETTLDGATRTYTTRLSAGTPANERSYDGRLGLSLVRELSPSRSNGLGVGLFADVQGGLLKHYYADPSGAISDYVHAVASIGPEVTWRQGIGDGLARFEVGTPLIGLVHRPYSDTRSVRPSPSVDFASLSSLRGVNAGVSYESSLGKRFGVIAAYRLRGLDLTGPSSYRNISNTFSIGVVTRFGRVKP